VRIIKHAMEHVMDTEIPFTANASAGKSWGSLEAISFEREPEVAKVEK